MAACAVYPPAYQNDARANPTFMDHVGISHSLNIEVDEEILSQIDHHIGIIVSHYSSQDLRQYQDLILVGEPPFKEPVRAPANDLTQLSFQADTTVTCITGDCQGVTMTGLANVEINLSTEQVSVHHLYAENLPHNMVLTGSIERVTTQNVLHHKARVDLVLSMDGEDINLDRNGRLFVYDEYLKDQVLDAFFLVNTEDFTIMLDGQMSAD